MSEVNYKRSATSSLMHQQSSGNLAKDKVHDTSARVSSVVIASALELILCFAVPANLADLYGVPGGYFPINLVGFVGKKILCSMLSHATETEYLVPDQMILPQIMKVCV